MNESVEGIINSNRKNKVALIITIWAVSATLFHLYSSYVGF